MRVRFATEDLPQRDRVEFWLDFVAKQVVRLTPSGRPDPATFQAQLNAYVAGRFTLYELQNSHLSGGRTTADVRGDNSHRLYLVRALRERVYNLSPRPAIAEEVRLAPGDFYVISDEWPYEAASKVWAPVCGLVIPHALLSPLLVGGNLTRPVLVTSGSPLGSMLAAAFDAALTQVPLLTPDLGDAVLQNLCGLVALACGASEEGRWSGRESLRAARLEAAKRHIDQHLAEPDLTPGTAAAALGISLRHLHLLFEPTGTSFAQYVAQRRLPQCRAALSGPMGVARSVTDIAFGWGFSNLTTFYRAFRREFGMAPGDLRATAAAGHSD